MLKRNFRLVKRGSFTFVYKRGERKSDRLLTLIYVKSKSLKVGFSVSNKIGNAITRNLVKRRLRAIVRSIIPSLRPSQIVVSVRVGVDKLSYSELQSAVEKLFTSAGLLKPNTPDQPTI